MGVAVANYSLFTIHYYLNFSFLTSHYYHNFLLLFARRSRLCIVVLTEVTTNMLHDVGQLPLVTARIAHQIGHYARRFIPTEVGILKFCIADVCAKYGKNFGTKGSYMSFEAYESRNLIHSVPLPRFGIAGAVALLISYLIDL